MGFFRNPFGKKEENSASTEGASTSPAADPRNDPNLIRVFDKFGRELFITKEQWRSSVLPGSIKSNWEDPDQLYGIIVGSLNDGFFAEDAAERLYRIDPVPSRRACVYGIVLMKSNRLEDAERVFRSYLQDRGEDGIVLTNLAKVYAARNDNNLAEETLWRALCRSGMVGKTDDKVFFNGRKDEFSGKYRAFAATDVAAELHRRHTAFPSTPILPGIR